MANRDSSCEMVALSAFGDTISYPGPTNLSCIAWAVSRSWDAVAETTTEQLESYDASINEIPSMVLILEMTVLEREIFTSMRNHVIWARSSRVDDITKFLWPSMLNEHCKDIYEDIQTHMGVAKERGDKQDTFRTLLPLGATTKFITRVSMRDLIKFLDYLWYVSTVNPRLTAQLQNTHATIVQEAFASLPELPKYAVSQFLEQGMPPAHERKDSVVESLGHIEVNMWMPFTLRTHLVRHRTFSVVDSFFDDFLLAENPWDFNIEAPIFCSVMATRRGWNFVAARRQCWIAHSDVWQPLLSKMFDSVDLNHSWLPCSDGECIYTEDIKLRMDPEKDPGPPCPRYCILHDDRPAEEAIFRMKKELVGRPDYWQRTFEDMMETHFRNE